MSDNAATTAKRGIEPKGGTIIADRYQIDKLVARGGMAAVYLAHHVKLNRPVALKILSPPPDADDSGAFEERFRLEAETLASLDHPNIVILHDFGDLDDGRFFLAMEYIEGPRMSDVLRDGPLPCERALNLILQVCSGLRYAHKRGVVHRDLKPSNLLIRTQDDGSELLKVVDFGLVKLTETDQSITRAGLILGSPHCMAPEQVKGHKVDNRADIYAIGVLLFRTLTGQYPFHGPNSAATMIAHLNQPVPTFFNVSPELVVPEEMEDIVRKCLAKNAADRYQSMKEVMDDLARCMEVPPEQFRSVSQSHSTIQRRTGAHPRPGRSPVLWFVLVAAVTVVLVGLPILSWFVYSNLPPTQVQSEVLSDGDVPPAPVAQPDARAAGTEDPDDPAPSDEEDAIDDAPPPQPEPEPAPRQLATPPPKPAPTPTVEKPPAPKTPPSPEPTAEDDLANGTADEPAPEEAPEGYMGIPDDLLD